jgi:hypothetical protein
MKAIAVAKVLLLIEFSPFISCGAGKENLEPVGLSSRGPQTDYSNYRAARTPRSRR